MFRLTTNPDTEPSTYVFDTDVVVLGYSERDDIDFPLSDPTLSREHLRIFEGPEGYIIENTAQDPFATVNDLPFGKRRLRTGDKIQAGFVILLFEEGGPAVREVSLDTEERVDVLPIGRTTKLLPKRSKVFAGSLLLLCLLSFFTLAKGGLDLLEREKEAAEHIAIQVVADTAMALNYTKIYESGPDRQIFSDPHFMEKGLVAVLGKVESYATQVDAQGRFKEMPYILRIYTSPDLGQFLVMAQPTPTLFNWLWPRGSVVVDSSLMDLRKVEDIKELNRLLVYLNAPEEGRAYADLVTDFLKKQPQVSLVELSRKFPNKGYSPPLELKVVKPGAENYIYNAPRYYSFTERVASLAVEVLEGSQGRKLVAKLRSALENLSHFSDLVYYTTQGSTFARQLKGALKVWSEREDFVATLFLTDRGEFLSHTLVLDEAPTLESKLIEEEVAFEVPLPPIPFEEEMGVSVDEGAPLFKKMREISLAREEQLSSIGEEMIALIEAENQTPTLNFFGAMRTYLSRYKEVSQECQQTAINDVVSLYQEYCHVPFARFFAYAKRAGVDSYILENQRVQRKLGDRDVLTCEEFQGLLDQIHEALDGEALEGVMREVASLLTLHTVPSAEDLILYQKTVRIEVLERLKVLEDSISPSQLELIRRLGWIEEV